MPRRNQSAPHTPFRFASNCQSKRRFATEREAQETAEHQMLLKPGLQLATYKCELCGGWHLTRRVQK
jgi:hypothetical protein